MTTMTTKKTATIPEPMKKIGDKITWTSQAGGFAVEKSGTVVAIVRGTASGGGGGDDLFDMAEKHGLNGQPVLPSHVKGQAHSFADRYLVRVVQHGAKGQKTALFYAPAVKVIDNALRKAKAAKGARS